MSVSKDNEYLLKIMLIIIEKPEKHLLQEPWH